MSNEPASRKEYYKELYDRLDLMLNRINLYLEYYFIENPDGTVVFLKENKMVPKNLKPCWICRSQYSSKEEYKRKVEEMRKQTPQKIQWEHIKVENKVKIYNAQAISIYKKLKEYQSNFGEEIKYIEKDIPIIDKNHKNYRLYRHKIITDIHACSDTLKKLPTLVELSEQKQKKQKEISKKSRIDKKKIDFIKKLFDNDPSLENSTLVTLQAAIEEDLEWPKIFKQIPTQATLARYKKKILKKQ